MKPRIIESCPSKEWNELIEEHMNSNGEKIANLADRISKLEKECKYVYARKNGEDDYKFFAVWEKDKAYDVSDDICDLIAIPFTGAYAGTISVKDSNQEKNVPNTSNDHSAYGGSWMGVLELLYAIKQEDKNLLKSCYANKTSEITRGENPPQKEVKSHPGEIIGGHVFIDGNVTDIYLMPLCCGHNNCSYNNYWFKLSNIPRDQSLLLMKLKDVTRQ